MKKTVYIAKIDKSAEVRNILYVALYYVSDMEPL